jgi:antitoxin component YwqK of YwqJK toxin-antitoxin module
MRHFLSRFLLLASLLPGCRTKETKHYQVERFPDGSTVREEVKNGAANGRTVGYFPTGEIHYILYRRDGAVVGPAYGFDQLGRVRRIDYYVQGWRTGRVYEFYENGVLASCCTYANDKKAGMEYTFYPHGGLKTKGHYVKGEASGNFFVFYKSPANRVRICYQYCLVRGKPVINSERYYTPTGALSKQVDVLSIMLDKPVYQLRDTVTMVLTLHGPRFPHISATVAPFDAGFNGNDTTAGQLVYGRHQVVRVQVRPQHVGLNYVRGYVSDYDSGASPRKGVLYQTTEKPVYFQQSFLVK